MNAFNNQIESSAVRRSSSSLKRIAWGMLLLSPVPMISTQEARADLYNLLPTASGGVDQVNSAGQTFYESAETSLGAVGDC